MRNSESFVVWNMGDNNEGSHIYIFSTSHWKVLCRLNISKIAALLYDIHFPWTQMKVVKSALLQGRRDYFIFVEQVS